MTAQFRELRQHPLRGWWFWMIFLIPVALIVGLPVIMKWIG
jgi:hypothetical protein